MTPCGKYADVKQLGMIYDLAKDYTKKKKQLAVDVLISKFRHVYLYPLPFMELLKSSHVETLI